MIRLTFCIHLFLSTIICLPQVLAQQSDTNRRPLLVPFQVDGKWGLMDTLGHEVKAPGFCKYIEVLDDFSYYVIRGNDDDQRYWLMDSRSGERIDLGELKAGDPVLKMGEVWLYQFEKDNKTVLASPVTLESFTLDDRYRRIEAIQLHDLKEENKVSYLIAYDNDYMGNILVVEDHFKKAPQVPPFEKLDLISAIVKEDYSITTFPVGFAIDKTEKSEKPYALVEAPPPPPGLAEYPDLSDYKEGEPVPKIKPPAPIAPPAPVPPIPRDDPETETSEVYDFRLASKGTVPLNDSALTALFEAKVVLKSNIPGSVAMGGGIIKNGMGGDQSVELNQDFAIRQFTKKMSTGTYRHVYYLIHKHDDQTFTELVSDDDAQFDWATHRGDKLISIRFRGDNKKLKAYFDYNGIILPKGRLMVPSKYYQGETMKLFLLQ